MGTGTVKRAAATRVIEELAARREQVVAGIMEAVVPGHGGRRPDLEEGTGQAFDSILRSFTEGHRLVPEDVPFVRPVVRRAVLRGVSEAEILAAPHKVQRVIWDAIVELAADTDEGREAAVALTPVLMDYVEAASQVADETYIEITQALSSRASIVRFELLDDLLGGRQPEPGAKLNAARGCGLEEGASVVVVVAHAVEPPEDEAALPLAMRALARAPGDALEPLAVVREEELVIVRATAPDDAGRLAEALEEARQTLDADGLRLAIAMSAVHEGLDGIPLAYEEACLALEGMGDRAGLLALPAVSVLEYLILRAGSRTAWQLVPPAIRDFVDQDIAETGLLTDTLLAYVESDLNVKRAAQGLYIHPNTAHYRLSKVEERTGCNLRHFSDLEQLVIAIRLARSR